ncbi:MAG: ABC transporter ATP-binding protein, partial [Candidatus Sumerlaeota bacterium]|nr:ABC transporter ATP-binding protein [Candidatus Sumerlaeota bacterium]
MPKKIPDAVKMTEPNWRYVRPFVKYLRPHKWRLAAAFVAMLAVGVFGSFSLLLLIQPVSILFGAGRAKEAEQAVEKTLEKNRKVFERAVEERGAEGAENDPLYGALEELSGALSQREEVRKKGVVEKGAPSQLVQSLPLVQRARDWWDREVAPLKAWYDRNKKAAEAWLQGNPLLALWLFAGLLIGFTMVQAAAEYLSKYLLSYALYDAVIKIKQDIFSHIMHLDYAFFIKRTTGFLESRVSSDVTQIKDIFDALISDGVQQPILLVCTVAVLYIISPQLTIIALVGVAIGFWPLAHFAKQIRSVTRKSRRKVDELSSSIEESLRNFRVVKIFGAEEHEIGKFRALNKRLFKMFMSRRVARFASSPIMEIIGAAAGGVVLVIGGYLVLGTKTQAPILDSSKFLVYLLALTRFYSPMKKLSRVNLSWQEAAVSAARIREMFDTKPVVVEAPNAQPIDCVKKAIEFKHVAFSYGEKPVLEDINLRIEVGKVVALVGRSGAGKSTLANMLPRLFDPTAGAIEVDGVDMRRLKLADVRRLFGVVTQDTVLFNDTVEENIAYAAAAVDPERLLAASKAAYA